MLFLSSHLNADEENCVNAVYRLRDVLHLPITDTSISQQVKEHPDYPSLLSISDALNKWKVANVSIKVDKARLAELPIPFIAQISGKSTYLAVVKNVTDQMVELSDITANKWEKLSQEEFIQRWQGIAMLIDQEEGAGEKDYKEKSRKQFWRKSPVILTGIIVLLAWILTSLTAFSQSGIQVISAVSLFTLKLAGVYTGMLLLWYEIDQHNLTLQKVCKSGGKTNCNAILQSGAAKIAGITNWSEIGFFYFTGGFIALFVTQLSNASLFLLSWINILALPYTLFSVYYQWRVAKQWCALCLTVQGLLVLEFISALAGRTLTGIRLQDVPTPVLLTLAACFFLPALLWSLLKPVLLRAKENNTNKVELARLKHNHQIFQAVLDKQKSITETTPELGLLLGNPGAKHRIIKVCNPYCGPCAKAHPDVEELLHQNPNLLVQIIFTATNNENDTKAKPVKHLLALAEKNDPALLRNALDDWYNAPVKDYDLFAEKYKLNGELQKQSDKIQAMDDWCKANEIAFTPTFFVDGNKMPEIYKLQDMHYFLSE